MLNRKKKENKIHKIAHIYIYSITQSAIKTNNKKLESFLSAVELAYSSLSAPLKRIINNDFFYQDYPGWWKLIYKKNNYQRLKAIAVNNFLEIFYEI